LHSIDTKIIKVRGYKCEDPNPGIGPSGDIEPDTDSCT